MNAVTRPADNGRHPGGAAATPTLGTLHLEAAQLGLRAGAQPTGRWLVRDLAVVIRPGERWAVLGPNGAGKSSLLAAMAGLFAPSAGELRLQGRPLAGWAVGELARWRAWCPQFWSDPFPSTVRESAALAMPRDRWWDSEPRDATALDAALAALDLVALAEADVRQLSGGERQRVAIAAALLQQTPLLLLDEPASHLDMAHQQMLVALLHARSHEGLAVVASLHDLNLAWQFATHAVLLDGRGGSCSGGRDEVMTPDRLASAFGVAIEVAEQGGRRRFWAEAAR